MFESVVPELAGRRSRKPFYESLPLSIGAHGAVAAALLTGQLWTIDFPSQSPKLFAVYALTATPPPPPPPPPPPVTRSAVVQPARVVVPAALRNLAPTVIPDEIPVITEQQPQEVQVIGPDNDVMSGEMQGIEGGVIGGTIASVIPPVEPPPQREVVTVERDEPLPMQAISQDYPAYPEHARTRGWQDSLVVRYIIGKDGRVREVTTIRPPQMSIFEEEAHRKIRQWRFTPMIENGEAKEVVHELTVEFKIVRPSRVR